MLTLADRMMILPNQKALFNIPPDVTYLNCAYMAPLLRSVEQAGVEAISKRSRPWKISNDDWFEPGEELRTLFARIIHADAENIALIPSASYGIAVAANNIQLEKGQKIIVLDQQYPSNVYAWRELSKRSKAEIVTIKKEPGQTWTEAILEKIDETTGLVAIPNCHWTDGSLVDLEKVSRKVKEVNAKLVVDASQSAGAYPLDVNVIKPDFLVTVGYKWLLGPYNLGYLYADRKYCATGMPIEFSWLIKPGSEDFKKLVDYRDDYREGARRFDAGEYSSFIHIPMAISALKQVLEWGVENIQATLSTLTTEIEKRAQLPGYQATKSNSRAGHLIGIKLTDEQATRLSKVLPENKVYLSLRGASMRVAPYLYNDLHDVKKLFQFL